ncbi:fructose-2 6-bisphosphatase [Tripterygium wilfordii]|uniref:Fructose-2 6-bisphosphatase n=1 Tax=Tripterygium wilfordii TaxID=458696 RepID=A0A7J7CP49_TRIWF|nr:fructose-2 6-bisphosphatase [Tripterygium wilfordii]
MVQFLNETVLGLHEKLRTNFASNRDHHDKSQGLPQPNSHSLTNSIHDQEGRLNNHTTLICSIGIGKGFQGRSLKGA